MLGISDNVVQCQKDLENLQAPKRNQLVKWHFVARRLLLTIVIIFVIILFLPWQQNIQATGRVTTLRPEHRPQTVHATIAGRVEQWYVMEGQYVKEGDTIVRLSEVKTEYFDPEIVQRVSNQVQAKEAAIFSYDNKVAALEAQIAAMKRERENKIQQIQNKIRQAELKIESDRAAVEQAKVDIQIARRQFEGVKNLYDRGLKSLTELEEKRAKLQESEAKLVGAENKLAASQNDLDIFRTELVLTRNEYDNKIAKAEREVVVLKNVSLDEVFAHPVRLQLYPNPARQYVRVSYPVDGLIGSAEVWVINALGQVISQHTVAMPWPDAGYSFDVSTLPAGHYTIQVRQDGRLWGAAAFAHW